MKARIFEIKHFAVHDGNGIRTTVFFKGCPLRCKWCHNPEGLEYRMSFAYYQHLCTYCGKCITVCKQNLHKIDQNTHVIDRANCIHCGDCVWSCPVNALKFYGRDVSIDDILPELLQDKDFYVASGGGVTLSGGECLLQADVCSNLLKLLKENSIHTAVDTSGFVPRESIDKVLPYTDTFLYDIKTFDDSVHMTYTGQSNKRILENLRYLSSLNKDIEIRIPLIPSVNDNQMNQIGIMISKLPSKPKVRILPYHNYYHSKYKAIDLDNTFTATIPTDADVKNAKEVLQSHNCIVLD